MSTTQCNALLAEIESSAELDDEITDLFSDNQNFELDLDWFEVE